MDHSIRVESRLFGLRPVAVADAEFILDLRLDPALSRFIETSPSIDDQKKWLSDYLTRAGDYYFVIERTSDHVPVGTIAIYSMDTENHRAEWGRWVIRPRHQAAIESALLIYDVAFKTFQLDELYCQTLNENRSVVSFHNSCGLPTRPVEGFKTIHGRTWSLTEHYLTRDSWPATRRRLDTLSARLAAPRAAALAQSGGPA